MKHFTFEELLRSQVADKNDIINEPCTYGEGYVYYRLDCLVTYLLDPIRETFAVPMIVTSGYRCEKLNRLVGGVDNSQHRWGEAVDFYFEGFSKKDMADAFFEIAEKFDFDQLIYYRKKGFIHISFVERKNRHQVIIR